MATTGGSFHPARALRRWQGQPFGGGDAVFHAFTSGITGHAAWSLGDLYSSFRPSPGGGLSAGSRPVLMNDGATRRLRIPRAYPQHAQSLAADAATYGEPTSLAVPGLNVAAMRGVAATIYRSSDPAAPLHGPMQYPYVLATVTGPEGATSPRHNCVVHALTLFSAGLVGATPPPAFLHRHPAFAAGPLAANFKPYVYVRDALALVEDYLRATAGAG